MLYLSVSLIVLFISVFIFWRAAGSLSILKPNLISYVFYFNIVIQTYIAAVLVISNLDNHYVINRVQGDARVYGWLASMYLMIAFPTGMMISKLILTPNRGMNKLLFNYTSKKVLMHGSSGNALKYSVWIFSLISIFSCIYTFWIIGYHPFLKVATSTISEISTLRISVSRDFKGNVYIRNFFALTMMPILSYVWAFYYLNSKRALDLLMFLITFFFAISIIYFNFSKSPILLYILGYVFVYFYNYGFLKFKYFLLASFFAIFGVVFLYALSGVSGDILLTYNSGPIGRLILSQAGGLYVMFDIFPAYYDHIGFSSFSSFFSKILSLDYIDRAARIAMIHSNPLGIENQTAGVMNTIFIGEAWANFGILGVLISPLWVGFLLQTLYIYFLKAPKNPLNLAFFVSFSVGGAVTGGFNDYIYNVSFLMLLLMYCLVILVAYILISIFNDNLNKHL